MLALCQHNTLAYYAFYYAGIFDAGLDLDVSDHQDNYSNIIKIGIDLDICKSPQFPSTLNKRRQFHLSY